MMLGLQNKYRFSIFIFGVLLIFCCAHAPQNGRSNVLYQVSTINALLEGAYDGEVTCGDLLKKGDFGIGTFDALDGEMIAVDGKIYRVSVDGKAAQVPESEKSPFACVTFFKADRSFQFDQPLTLKELEKYFDVRLPSQNIFYAFRVDGIFKYVKTRSVPRQAKPYTRLVDIVKHQPVFELKDVKGTVIGFRSPDYVQGVNVPGYHFHFLTEDRKGGGHILDLQTAGTKADISPIHEVHIALPKGGVFYKLDLTGKSGELNKVEK